MALSLTGEYPQFLVQAKLPRLAFRLSPSSLRGLMHVLTTCLTPMPVEALPVPPPQAKFVERLALQQRRAGGDLASTRQIKAAAAE